MDLLFWQKIQNHLKTSMNVTSKLWLQKAKRVRLYQLSFFPSISTDTTRSSRPEVFLRKGVLKICSKVTGEHTCQKVTSIMLLCNFIEIAFQHGCPIVNLLHIFWLPFPENTCWWLLLYWNRISERVFSRKFTEYFQKNFSWEHLWGCFCTTLMIKYKMFNKSVLQDKSYKILLLTWQ